MGQAAIVLALLWWAWTQFTWIAGNANFDELGPRIVLLVATAATFVVATAVQGAFGEDGAIFALAYFGVMSLAALFYFSLVWGTDQPAGSMAYMPRAMAGSILVLIGGFVPEDFRIWFWVAAVIVNIVSTLAAGRNEYPIVPGHFAERHGLFVIIVLGEALIAIGVGTVGSSGSLAFYVAGTVMLLTALALWWSYFDWLFQVGEKRDKLYTMSSAPPHMTSMKRSAGSRASATRRSARSRRIANAPSGRHNATSGTGSAPKNANDGLASETPEPDPAIPTTGHSSGLPGYVVSPVELVEDGAIV
ncbi:MAG: low temperature requirement protein A [Acidimicrobiia bacterium]